MPWPGPPPFLAPPLGVDAPVDTPGVVDSSPADSRVPAKIAEGYFDIICETRTGIARRI